MVFLNEPGGGGETEFPQLSFKMMPRTGMLLIWNNMMPDGRPNLHLLHSGNPVTAQDVVWSLKRLMTLNLAQASFLKSRGFTADAADTLFVAGLHDTEFARAHTLWARRFDALPGDARERGRQGRFLLTRGFSGEVIHRVLRGEVPDDRDSQA